MGESKEEEEDRDERLSEREVVREKRRKIRGEVELLERFHAMHCMV